MQLKLSSLILCLVAVFSTVAHGYTVDAVSRESTSEVSADLREQNQKEKQKQLSTILKFVVKGIKKLAMILCGAGGVVIGAEYFFWRLAEHFGDEGRKLLVLNHKLRASYEAKKGL